MPYRGMGYDPIGAGISAFTSLTSLFDRQAMQEEEKKNLASRRQLMAEEVEDRKLQRARDTQRMAAEKAQMEYNQFSRNLMKQSALRGEQLLKLTGAQAKLEAGAKLDPDEQKAVFSVMHGNNIFKDVPPEEWDNLSKNLDTLKDGVDKFWPQIASKLTDKQGVYVKEDQAPEWFNALNKVYENQINRGESQYKGNSQKRITQVYFDPRTGTMTPQLRVQGPEGEVYYAPMTVDRGTDPNAPVLQMPYQLFGKQLDANIGLMKMINAERIALGDKEARKVWETERETVKQNQVFLTGHNAVDDLLRANPKATLTDQYNTALKAARGYAKDNNISVKDKDLVSEFDQYYKAKTQKLPPSIEEAKAYNEMSKEEKDAFDKIQDRKTSHQRTMAKVAEDRLEETKRANAEKEKLEKSKLAKEKEVKPEIKQDAEGNLLRIDPKAGTSRPVTDEKGNPVKGKKELSASDLRLIDKKSNDAKKTIEEDSDIDVSDKNEVAARVSDLITEDPKLTHIQAIDKIKKSMKIRSQSQFPDPKKNKDQIGTDKETGIRYKSDGFRWNKIMENE